MKHFLQDTEPRHLCSVILVYPAFGPLVFGALLKRLITLLTTSALFAFRTLIDLRLFPLNRSTAPVTRLLTVTFLAGTQAA